MTTSELLARRDELHAEMTNAPSAKRDSQWMADRVNEMAWLNRQLVRLGAIPATAPADDAELAAHAAAWCGDRDDAPTVDHDAADEAWWAEHAPSNADAFDVLA